MAMESSSVEDDANIVEGKQSLAHRHLDAVSDRRCLSDSSGRRRLQEMLITFTRQIRRGRPITILGRVDANQQLTRWPATVRLQKDLASLSITCSGNFTISLALGNIKDIYCVDGDGDKAFPHRILDCLDKKDIEKLLRLDFIGAPSHAGQTSTAPLAETIHLDQTVYLLESSVDSKEQFLENMKILCALSNTKGLRSPAISDARGVMEV